MRRSPELTFIDEKECRQVCSTLIMSFCEERGNQILAPRLNIGTSVIQAKAANNGDEYREGTERDYTLPLSISECLEYLKILTPAELVINSRDLMISSRHPEERSREPFSVTRLVLEEKDKMFPGAIIFIENAELDIENLSFDVDKVEVKVLEYLQISETFNIQSRILGKPMELPMPDDGSLNLEIRPFLSLYLPHMLAKELKHVFIDEEKKELANLDIIGMVCSTVKYMPFLQFIEEQGEKNRKIYHRKKIKDRKELQSMIYNKIDKDILEECTTVDIEDESNRQTVLLEFLKVCKKELGRERFLGKRSKKIDYDTKSNHHSLKIDPKSLSNALGRPKLNYCIQPIAIWVYRR
jgi:hypothetical protein